MEADMIFKRVMSELLSTFLVDIDSYNTEHSMIVQPYLTVQTQEERTHKFEVLCHLCSEFAPREQNPRWRSVYYEAVSFLRKMWMAGEFGITNYESSHFDRMLHDCIDIVGDGSRLDSRMINNMIRIEIIQIKIFLDLQNIQMSNIK